MTLKRRENKNLVSFICFSFLMMMMIIIIIIIIIIQCNNTVTAR